MVINKADQPLTENDLAEFEARLSLKLPSDYRRFLLKNNGGKPSPGFFQFLRDGQKLEWTWVQQLKSLKPQKNVYYDIEDVPEWRREETPPEAFAIGSAAGDQDIILYCKGKLSGQVWLKDFEMCQEEGDPNEQLHFIASSFDAFLEALKPAPPHLA